MQIIYKIEEKDKLFVHMNSINKTVFDRDFEFHFYLDIHPTFFYYKYKSLRGYKPDHYVKASKMVKIKNRLKSYAPNYDFDILQILEKHYSIEIIRSFYFIYFNLTYLL